MTDHEKTFGVLFSNASPSIWDDLICPQHFAYRAHADQFGHAVGRSSGSEYEVMELTPGGWRSSWDENRAEVINRRWIPHPEHKHDYSVPHTKRTKSRVRLPETAMFCSICGTRERKTRL